MSIAATIRENLMIALRPIRLGGSTILAVIAAARRRDRREHTAGYRIDPLDAILGDLKQVLAVEGRSCVRGDINRAQRLPTRRIEGVQLVSGATPLVTLPSRAS
jgi:hypothetical protein